MGERGNRTCNMEEGKTHSRNSKQTNKTQTTEGMSWKVLTEKTHIICFSFMDFLQEQKGLERLDFSNRRSVNPEIFMLRLV